MVSAFETFRRLGPAAFVLKAIISVIVADVLLLGFIMLRRTYRRRYFAKRDGRLFEFRERWDALISGEIPYATWRTKPSDRQLVETMVLDAFEVAGPEESGRLLKFMRASGLVEKSISDARNHQGWRRHHALVALGRTRAPEGIPALAEGLRDRNPETRLAALRGLGQMACPEAAVEILNWVGEAGLVVPALPLQSALVQTCAERPQVLLPYLQHAGASVREVLARVLGEVATPSLGAEVLQFAEDTLPELRAAAARALSYMEPGLAVNVLSELARDPIWFVRLRAIVSLGRLGHGSGTPVLLHGLNDSNRLVRLRAAEALVDLEIEMVPIFEKVIAMGDRYGLHAYLTALENAGLQAQLEGEIRAMRRGSKEVKTRLLEVLRAGPTPPEQNGPQEKVSAVAASRS
ncbi:MAG TPA: HEAT repeat domain-containing protein [Terriglobales bacterium]|nr:HEAT repeat domain-containing protein [Terriglobales bacterium]